MTAPISNQIRRVAVLDDYERTVATYADWQRLGDGTEIDFIDTWLEDDAARTLRLQPYDCIVLMRERTPISGQLIHSLPNLKLIMTTGHGNASIDYAAANQQGVQVCGTMTYGHPTAELVWGLIIALQRHIVMAASDLTRGVWMPRIGQPLKGRTLGIVGLGRIGSAVAKVAQAFDMNVIAWSANLTAERAESLGCRRVELDELLSNSDIVTLHVILGERYRNLIGARELGLMRRHAVIVNTSRAALIEEHALIDALEETRIAGAALDVSWQEPLASGHPLLALSNALVTPHLGYVTEDNFRNGYRQIVEGILAFQRGELIRPLNKPAN